MYYGTTAAGIAKRHPGKARPLHVSPWTTAAWLALAARRPLAAIAITAAADRAARPRARGRRAGPARTATRLAAGGTLRSGRVVADALTRHWWPLSVLAALAVPRTRLPLAAAFLSDPRKLPDDLAYGFGLWRGLPQTAHAGPAAAREALALARRELRWGGAALR